MIQSQGGSFPKIYKPEVVRSAFSARNRLLSLLIVMAGIWFWSYQSSAMADDDHHDKWRGAQGRSSYQLQNKDEGNELTGQLAAWIFGTANITVGFGLLSRILIRRFQGKNQFVDRIRRFNRFQKRLLLPVHYFLNPLALLLAITHFSLSACRSSALPEWGLAIMAVITGIGAMVKFKKSPQGLRKYVYKLHTNPFPLFLLLTVLLIGHQLVD
jgi:hypothetical protein